MWHHVNFGHGDQCGHGGRSMKHITNRWPRCTLVGMVFSGCDDSSPVGASPTQEDGGAVHWMRDLWMPTSFRQRMVAQG